MPIRLAATDYYKLLVRPVIVVTTLFENNKVNAAPFSFSTPLSFSPPLVSFATSRSHHTYANAKRTGEFVINVVGEKIGPRLRVLEQDWPKGVSELEKARLTPKPSVQVGTPGIMEAYGWIECKLWADYEAGDHNLLVGKVVHVEVRDNCWQKRLLLAEAAPLFHVSGANFATNAKGTKYERAK